MYTVSISIKGVFMSLAKSNVFSFIIIGIVSMVLLTATTAAHVVVRPSEVVTASYQTFTISVPNEKEIPTTTVELLIPSGVASVTPTKKANWQITTKTDGDGDAQRVTY